MRLLIIHNEYGAISGEEVMLDHVAELLVQRGHPVHRYTRSSREIQGKRFGKALALFNGVYSASARADVRAIIKSFRPDVAIVKNLFPLISPAILPVLSKAGVPVVMVVSNYRLVCPNGLHFAHGKVCERCVGGKEYHCILQNCEGNLAKSFGYALRNWVSRQAGWYKNHVAEFVCASEFLKSKLVNAGFDGARMHLIPNTVPDQLAGRPVTPAGEGDYVAYAGRISKEKGIQTLLRAAALCPQIQFKVAGRINIHENCLDPRLENVTFTGFLQADALVDFIAGSRFVLSTSECYETFGMSIAEAMSCARPVIASRIGVFPEFVNEGIDGLLFEPQDAVDLAGKIRSLWSQPELCTMMGAAGRQKALANYSEQKYYSSLMAALNAALKSPFMGEVVQPRGLGV